MKVAATTNQPRRNQRGFFLVIVLLALTAIMLIYLTVDARRLAALKQDLRLIEQKQVQRLNLAESGVATNLPPTPSASAP